MADYDFPDRLLELQRAYYRADAKVQEVTDGLPSSLDIVAGAASISKEQRAVLAKAREKRLAIVDKLYDDPWWEQVDDKYAAKQALEQLARS